jgi:hypothetical protein
MKVNINQGSIGTGAPLCRARDYSASENLYQSAHHKLRNYTRIVGTVGYSLLAQILKLFSS